MSGETTDTAKAPPGPVLVVDDDEAVRHSLKFALELEGLEVRVYRSGPEILGDANLPEAGCLVVDYYMPEMTGVELIDSLRRRHVALPAILVTGKVTEQLRQHAARAGFREVIEKPCHDGRLADGIRHALSASA
jgi:FixJ family two-component response regulator